MRIPLRLPLIGFVLTMILGAMISQGTTYIMTREGIDPNQTQMLDMQINRDLESSIQAMEGYGIQGRGILLRYTYPLDMALPFFLGGTLVLFMVHLMQKGRRELGWEKGLLLLPGISALSDLCENICSIGVIRIFETGNVESLLITGRIFTLSKFTFMILSLGGILYLYIRNKIEKKR